MAAVDARDKKAVCALAVSGCVRIEGVVSRTAKQGTQLKLMFCKYRWSD